MAVWLVNIRARLWLDFRFYKHIGDLDAFKQRWCFNDIVCSVVNEELVFAQVFSRLLEEVGYAVGEVVGFDSVKSASRMNSAVVIFLDQVCKVEQVVEAGIVLRDTFTPVFPLVNPSKKVIISNAPPFIKNDDLRKALARYGQIVSPIKMLLLGCKSPKLKHVVCHRRQLFMIPKDADSHLNLTLTFKIDGFNYIVFVTSDTMKCFGCGAEGHLIRACPEARKGNAGAPGPERVAGTAVPAEAAAPAEAEADGVAEIVGVSGPEKTAETAVPAGIVGASGPERAAGIAVPAETAGVAEIVGASGPERAAGIAIPAETAGVAEIVGASGVEQMVEAAVPAGIVGASGPERTAEAAGVAEIVGDLKSGQPEEDDGASGSSMVVKNAEDGNMNDDVLMDDVFDERGLSINTSTKRKKSADKGQGESLSDEEEEAELTISQEERITSYSVEKIRRFLAETKGLRAVKTEQFFPDLNGFIRSINQLRKDDAFSDQEIYRLKKLVTKAKAALIEDDD
ncbi:Transposon TX1 uncharacterized protein [Merluccius polli]|uniref:Transposon TX1 uncharacterized protein n=1 Tax=Merluccius polli TaxID=89951 RepID=A0AA47NBD9_MERPO|nr:Transposon TX1 uncharacterized protein [Merluccius polli]